MIKMIETDKNGDVRRGASRFSRQIKQSGHKFISGLNGVVAGDFVSPDKSNKKRIKKLSAVNRASSSNQDKNYEMGGDIADREESLPSQAPINGGATSKKFKLPRKQFLDDCNGVDHVSVPRKLRSAMKKRNGESTSLPFPDSKKLNYSSGGAESPKRVGIKRSKLNLKQGGPNWSLKQSVDGPITKDEEEVVETLYALAGMFPDNDSDSKSKTDNASSSLDASASALPGPSESHPSKLEVMKEDLNANCPSRTDEAVNPASDIERSPEETTKATSLNGSSIHERSDFHSSEKLEGSDSLVAQVKLHKTLVKHEEQKPTCNSVNFCFPPGPHQDNGKLKQPAKFDTLLLDRKPEITLGLTTTFGSQLDQQHMTNESKNNGPASWSGFPSTLSSTFCHGPLSQSCAAKIPAWFGTRPGSLQNDSSTGKVFKVSSDRRSWKRCASHVYICRLIRALQVPETKESLELPNKLKPHEILKQGVLMSINEFNSIRNYLNGVSSSNGIVNTTKKNSNDTKIGNLQHLRLQQDHSQAALASAAYNSQKQSFNFLSLSAGGGGMEPNISYNGTGTCSEPVAQLQVPYPTLMPFSMSQTRYTSAYPDSAAAAAPPQQAQLQLPPHFSSPYCGPHASPKALTKQQQLWAAQLAQYGNAGSSTAMTNFPSWQNGRQASPAMIPCIPTSPSTLEILGPKYRHDPHQQQHQQHHQHQHHQQQQFVVINSPHGRIKRQDRHLSSVYEETGVGFCAGGGALPLQLLCNEHL